MGCPVVDRAIVSSCMGNSAHHECSQGRCSENAVAIAFAESTNRQGRSVTALFSLTAASETTDESHTQRLRGCKAASRMDRKLWEEYRSGPASSRGRWTEEMQQQYVLLEASCVTFASVPGWVAIAQGSGMIIAKCDMANRSGSWSR